MLELISRAEGDADADPDWFIDSQIAEDRRVEQALAALRDLLGLGRGSARQEGGELVAAEAVQAVVGARRAITSASAMMDSTRSPLAWP